MKKYDKENIRKAIILASQNKKKEDIQRYLNNIDYYVNVILSIKE